MSTVLASVQDIPLAHLLSSLAGQVPILEISGDSHAPVSSLVLDSRQALPGSLFVCVEGSREDGRRYVPDAVSRGARAVLYERPLERHLTSSGDAGTTLGAGGASVPSLVRVPVGMARRAAGYLAEAIAGMPALALQLLAVTGTNGKTTVVSMLQAILQAAGMEASAIGTLTQERTTPDAPELARVLADQLSAGKRVVAMEASSHAIAQERIAGLRFDVVGFTNLSHDHLDYHKTMENYFNAKAALFDPYYASRAVVMVDDPWGSRLSELARQRGLQVREASADQASELVVTAGEIRMRLGDLRLRVPMGGTFQVPNIVLSATMALEFGIDRDAIVEGLSHLEPVPGRFELLQADPFTVVVDYAHTPAALVALLKSARGVTPGRLAVVFGCGGERDLGKRPTMGEISVGYADLAVITSDNPRGEDPNAIIAAVEAGARAARSAGASGDLIIEPDRRVAIETAIAWARRGDCVVIAGKGHEAVQVAGGLATGFDDRVEAKRALSQKASTWSRS